ncbi:WAT1-related protein [Tripterygium wilfordii]|uniref:WAT1-related protein n=1 Tax=Tripterygium wilfordii TaxID=458696 RepID=A0A7J7D1S8_TRIWF|nr:WAT1-related protein At4g08300-like [Tripterygium wilfordii]KAF5740312.1 WAT1-related protein [Tripterygium wilfordii]
MVRETLNKVKPYLGMISLQFGYAGMFIISLVSLNKGMNHYVLAVYRHVVATIVILPFALLFERKTRPKLTLPIFLRIVALGFLEPVLDQNLYYLGLKYTSASFTSAVVNVLPAITFIMALIFRLESVNLKKIYSVAKVIGTIITVSGALVMTLYRGPIIDFLHRREHIHHETNSESSNHQHHLAGTLMLLGSVTGWSGFFVLQSFTLKKYPAELSLTALVCLMGVVEGTVVTLIMERDMSVWKIGFDSRLIAAVYSGVVCSGLAYYVQGLVIKEKGPVFVTAFSPLCMIITCALGAIILAEKVHLGSIIGAIFIVMGLYTVVWGKSKEGPNIRTAASLTNIEKNGDNLELPIKNDTKSVLVVSSNVNGAHGGAEEVKIPAQCT